MPVAASGIRFIAITPDTAPAATDAAAPRQRLFYGYILLGYSFAVSFLASSFFLHSRGIFFPLWIEEFGVARTEIAAAVTFTLLTGSCVAPLSGWLIDRFPVRFIVSIGAAWLAAGYWLLSGVDTYAEFLFTLVIFQGLGWTCVGPLVQTKLMVNWFTRNRGMALGVAIMGISVAGVVMPGVAALLSETIGWRTTYIVYSGLLVALVIPMTLLIVRQRPADIGQYPDGDPAPPPLAAPAGPPPRTGLAVYREFLSSGAFWSVVLTFGLMNGIYSAMITHLPNYLATELDTGPYAAALVLTVASGFAVAGKIAFGWMMDHLPAKVTVMCGVGAYLASTVVFNTVTSYWLIVLAAALFGLGFGGMVPVRSVLLSRLFGVARFSRVNGLFSFFLAPATLWVLITGWIADQTGTYTTAFKVWAVSFCLAGVISLLVRLPNREDAVP